MQVKVPERVLQVEEYVETNLTALGKALEMQGRALSVFKDRQELTGPGGEALPAIQVQFVRPEDLAGAGSGSGSGAGSGSAAAADGSRA